MPRLSFLGSLGPAVVAFLLPLGLLAQPETENEGPAPGETIHIDEGWYRIEPEGTPEEGFVGTLEVEEEEERPPERETEASPPRSSHPKYELPETSCREERARYLQELFRMAGIWDAPWALDFVEALEARESSLSPWLRFNLFGQVEGGSAFALPPGIDPFRPLAWDQELRYAAEALASCERSRHSSVTRP